MNVQTGLANSIDASGDRARLDAVAKKLIRHKIILAEILRACVEEFRGCDAGFIQEHCIVGEVKMDQLSVDQDVRDADATVTGSNTEDSSDSEGVIRYDLVFDAQVPNSRELIRLIINVEIQADTNPGYSLITRAIYYLGRLISRQKGTVFTNSDYGKLRKVYTIWICPDPKRLNTNGIAEYGFTQQKVVGQIDEPVENYDKMKAVIISLNDEGMENRSEIIRLLSTLLSTKKSVEQRKQILETEFNIPMTREIEEEVDEMCNLGLAVELKGREEGMAEGMAQGIAEGKAKGMAEGMAQGLVRAKTDDIKSLMETLKLSAKQAMDALRIPESEQAEYAARL